MKYAPKMVLILLFLVGCTATPWPKPEKKLYTKGVTVGNRVTLHIPVGLSDQERALLISAASIQLETFERDWGKGTRPVHVWFSRGEGKYILCGSREGRFWGCHYGPDGPIHVWLDKYFTAIVLYHELVHHNYNNGNDHNHEDPRWESNWKPRQKEIRLNLFYKHRRILGRR